MRKFRFVGDPSEYEWEKKPIKGDDYTLSQINKQTGFSIVLSAEDLLSGTGWQEVFDSENEAYIKLRDEVMNMSEQPPKPLHKGTDLGYYAGLAMQGILAQNDLLPEIVAEHSISCAKELIKQLNEEAK